MVDSVLIKLVNNNYRQDCNYALENQLLGSYRVAKSFWESKTSTFPSINNGNNRNYPCYIVYCLISGTRNSSCVR